MPISADDRVKAIFMMFGLRREIVQMLDEDLIHWAWMGEAEEIGAVIRYLGKLKTQIFESVPQIKGDGNENQ